MVFQRVQLFIFLKNKKDIEIKEGKFLYNNNRLQRKRLIIKIQNLNEFTLDILIHKNFYLKKTNIFPEITNIYTATMEDILSEYIISLSQTDIGMVFDNRINKAIEITKRINYLQYKIKKEKMLASLKHILEIQNYFYEKEYSLCDILSGAHIFSKKLQKKYYIKYAEKLNIDYIILILSQLIYLNNDNTINFYNSKEKYGLFSNFSNHKVIYNDIEYPTSEHCYQAQKTTNLDLHYKILNQKTPKDAAFFGRNLKKEYLRNDWDFIKTTIMYNIVKAKILQNPDIYILLISTKNKKIIETSYTDSFWGIGKNKKGKNVLGRILESIRKDIMWN